MIPLSPIVHQNSRSESPFHGSPRAGTSELGGSIAVPKIPIPGMGWLAYIKDTEGNTLGLMQADPTAA